MLPEYIEDLFVAIVPTGSRVICNPPPTDTDADFVCLAEDPASLADAYEVLADTGWEQDGAYAEMLSQFTSYRKGEINLIVAKDKQFFTLMVKATVEAKKLNLLDKAERIALFDKVFEEGGLPRKKNCPISSEIKAMMNAFQQQQVLVADALGQQPPVVNAWQDCFFDDVEPEF